jgi:uncharacterized membrane protein YedE/YeeE
MRPVTAFSAFAVGLLFGAGLAVSQMIDPAKVLAFLDIAGDWDPTLLVVMAVALVAAAPGYAIARRRARSWLGQPMQIPARRDLDAPLLGGAAIFGVGWGLAGFCPGPALAALGTGMPDVFVFVAAMVVGMLAHRLKQARRT